MDAQRRPCLPLRSNRFDIRPTGKSCTLLARWDEDYADPWLIITDLTPQQARICWYGMLRWIECLFKELKRGGFGWHHTKMIDPQRAERLGLAIAVATLYLVSIGGQESR